MSMPRWSRRATTSPVMHLRGRRWMRSSPGPTSCREPRAFTGGEQCTLPRHVHDTSQNTSHTSLTLRRDTSQTLAHQVHLTMVASTTCSLLFPPSPSLPIPLFPIFIQRQFSGRGGRRFSQTIVQANCNSHKTQLAQQPFSGRGGRRFS